MKMNRPFSTESAETFKVNVWPTRLSLDRARRADLERADGIWDGRTHVSFRNLQDRLFVAARRAGKLRGRIPEDVDLALFMIQAAAAFPDDPDTPLSPRTRLDLLRALQNELLLPAADMQVVLDAMELSSAPRIRTCASLFRRFVEIVRGAGFALPQDAMQAVLDALADRQEGLRILQFALHLPRPPQPGRLRLRFHAVRWLTPFQMRLAERLASILGREGVEITPAVPQEYGPESLLGRLAGLLRDPDTGAAPAAWVLDVSDAFTVQDPELARSAAPNVEFNRSAGVYGEIEDLARRIRFEITERRVPPHEIALVVRDLGAYSDAVTDVFERFDIPCFFRRGVPAASIPLVKTVLRMADFRGAPTRDVFCALLESRWLTWPQLRNVRTPQQLATDIRRAGVAPVCENLQRDLVERLRELYDNTTSPESRDCGCAGEWTDAAPERAAQIWETITEAADEELTVGEHAVRLRKVLHACGLAQALDEFRENPDASDQEAVELNLSAWDTLDALLNRLAAPSASGFEPLRMTADEFTILLTDLVRNRTISTGLSRPHGVHVLNPYDTAGLRFRVVLVAGLNAGEFPPAAISDALVPDDLRAQLHAAEKSAAVGLPPCALPESHMRSRQEDVLFLMVLAAAGERIVLSYHACETDGTELAPSVYFTAMWQLVGWAAPESDLALSEYDRRRIDLDRAGFLAQHYEEQQRRQAPWQRAPLPGESFRTTAPLALCCAEDEARQRIAALARTSPEHCETPVPLESRLQSCEERDADVARRIVAALKVESYRHEYFERALDAVPTAAPLPADGARWCGGIPASAPRLQTVHISPTAIETLAACPFRYLIEHVYRAEPLIPADFEPDPRDRGSIIHQALQCFGRFLAGASPEDIGLPGLDETRWRTLRCPVTVSCSPAGDWRIEPGCRGPVVGAELDRERVEEYVELLEAIVKNLLHGQTRHWKLGDPRLRPLREQRLRQSAENLLRTELAVRKWGSRKKIPCPPWLQNPEDVRNVWLFFEQRFEVDAPREVHGNADIATAATSQSGSIQCRIRGSIDRLDLVFERPTGRLAAVRVVDYKSASFVGRHRKTLRLEICTALDSQLPAYALAAGELLRKCFPDCPDLAADSLRSRIYAQYLGYHVRRSLSESTVDAFVNMADPVPDEMSERADLTLIDAFTDRLHVLLSFPASSRYPVMPARCDYCRFQGVCRIPRTKESRSRYG